MRRAHKLLSLLLVLTLALSLCAPVGAAYSDTNGHWAESSIDRWSGYGVLNGKGGGGFDPDGSMTRAEFAQMLCNMMGYTEKAGNTFADVPDDAWYADAMLRLAAAGVISGVGGNMAAPDAPITREQAAVMLCRAFNIKSGGSAAMGFADAGSVASWARDSVAALAGMGMIGGVGDNKVAPKLNINRASVAKLVDNMVAEYVTEDKTITGEVKGVVIVAGGAKVTFDSASVSAPILVAPSAGGAKVELTGTTSAENVVVAAEKAAVTVGKDAAAESVTASGDKAEIRVEGKADAVAVEGEGAKVDVSGTVGTVSTEAANTSVAVSGTVGTVEVAAGADKTEISTSSTAKIDSVTTGAENVKVSGTGSVGSVTAEGGSADVSTKGTEVKNEGAGNVTAGGKPVESGSTSTSSGSTSTSSGSSSGGGHTHSWGEGEVTTPATCTEAGVKTFTCSCGRTRTEAIPATGHTPAEEYTKNEEGHWHVCTVCNRVADEGEHNYGEVTDCSVAATCNVCGYEKAEGTHIWDWDNFAVTKEATCTEAGEKTYTCACGKSTKTVEIPALGHSYATEWSSDIGMHWHACTRCNDTDVQGDLAPHNFGNSFDCTKAAVCTVCAYERAAASEHQAPVEDPAVAATCTEPGKSAGSHCGYCNKVITAQKTVAALGHDFTGTYLNDAEGHWHMCTRCDAIDAKADHTYQTNACDAAADCTACGYTKSAGQHSWGAWSSQDATNHVHTCSVCKKTSTEAHKWDNGVVTIEPTETTEGVKTFTCSVCNGTKTESIPVVVVGAAKAWIEATNFAIYLYWTPKEGFNGTYQVNGNNAGSSNFKNLTFELVDCTTAGPISYEIKTVVTGGSAPVIEPYATAENIVNVELGTEKPNVSIVGQEDGEYKFEATDGYTGTYSYELKAPDGSTIRSGSVRAGNTVEAAPYADCKFSVRKISWNQTGSELPNITVTLSAVAELGFSAYDFSETTAEVSTEEEFKAAMNKGGTVKVIADFDITNTSITSGGDVILDLNGHTLSNGTNTIGIYNGKTVRIVDSSKAKTGKLTGAPIGAYSGSVLICEGGEYDRIDSSGGNGKANSREVTLIGVKAGQLQIGATDKVVITNCTVGDVGTLFNYSKDVEITGGQVGKLTINVSCGNIAVKGATINDMTVNSGRVTLEDVSFDENSQDYSRMIRVKGSDTQLTIKSGTYISASSVGMFYPSPSDGTVEILGGMFSEDPSAYVPDGYPVTASADGKTWTVGEAAAEQEVTDEPTLKAAIAKGGKVKMMQDITLEVDNENDKFGNLVINKDVSLDLNGHTLTTTGINVTAGELTIEGTKEGSAVVCTSDKENGNLWVEQQGKLTLNGGTYKEFYVYCASSNGVYVNNCTFERVKTTYADGLFVSRDGGVIEVDGGKYDAEPLSLASANGTATSVTIKSGTFSAKALVGYLAGQGIVTISGGTYKCSLSEMNINNNGKLSITGGTFSENPPETYLAEGYKATESDGTWTVTAE